MIQAPPHTNVLFTTGATSQPRASCVVLSPRRQSISFCRVSNNSTVAIPHLPRAQTTTNTNTKLLSRVLSRRYAQVYNTHTHTHTCDARAWLGVGRTRPPSQTCMSASALGLLPLRRLDTLALLRSFIRSSFVRSFVVGHKQQRTTERRTNERRTNDAKTNDDIVWWYCLNSLI